jgi:hypothetical protein
VLQMVCISVRWVARLTAEAQRLSPPSRDELVEDIFKSGLNLPAVLLLCHWMHLHHKPCCAMLKGLRYVDV